MDRLTEFQKDIFNECVLKKSGGLSLNMGQGKTLIGLCLAKTFSETGQGNKKSIIVASKNLVGNWVSELKKFFGDSLSYLVFHQDNVKNLDAFLYETLNARIVIVTPEVLTKFYKKYNIETKFVTEFFQVHANGNLPIRQILYNKVNDSLGNFDGTLGSALFSQQWGSVIVDEVQNHTNIKVSKCRAICSIFSKNRWVMSGTLFNEPKIERILGYYCMINSQTFPRTLSDTSTFVSSRHFKGIQETLVYRAPKEVTNKNGKVSCNHHIITHSLTPNEELIYVSMKVILNSIKERVDAYKNTGDFENMRKYSAYLMAMLTYLRQTIVSPILVLASCSLDIIDLKSNSELAKTIFDKMNGLGLGEYLNDIESIKSSRIKCVLEQIDKHPNDNIVIFSSFRTSIDILRSYVPSDRQTFSIDGSMSINRREAVISQFKITRDFGNVLFLTYDIGAEGLNLQESNTVMLLDMGWNDGKSKQAIARVLRNGQQSDSVSVYVFTSNTGIEKAILGKQDEKLVVLDEMNSGPIRSKVAGIKVQEIINMININDCVNSLTTKFR